MTYNGLWFFGLSGSGKTFASDYLSNKINNSFIIDGDKVRDLISNDLDYSLESRIIQLNRVLGLSSLVTLNNYFPIVSTVYMTKNIQKNLINNNFLLIKIERTLSDAKNNNPTYLDNKNVVGIDILYENFLYEKITNTGGVEFCKILDKIII
tara:strand:- start:11391 stop:11846 length:456 start_codon:yes stop_codon:yes gene_type:complete